VKVFVGAVIRSTTMETLRPQQSHGIFRPVTGLVPEQESPI